MVNWKKISDIISTATGADFSITQATPLSGGYTNQAWHLQGQAEAGRNQARHYFVKLNSADKTGMYAAERAGLAAIAASHTVRVPRVIAQGMFDQYTFLVLEYLHLQNKGDSRLLGTQLAALHRVHSEKFGWERDNTLGLTAQHNAWNPDWTAFWREHRLGYQLDLAAHNGYSGALLKMGRSLLDVLPEILADHHPAASLLHGDLWGGNYGFLEDGSPVLFDPATYYGDREADIAMTELFSGFNHDFYASYHEAYPLEAGYARRKTLYNLYHILNHCNMVSDSYVPQAEGMMRQLLAELG